MRGYFEAGKEREKERNERCGRKYPLSSLEINFLVTTVLVSPIQDAYAAPHVNFFAACVCAVRGVSVADNVDPDSMS